MADYIFDTARKRVYVTNTTNTIQRFDLTTHQFLTPWTIAGSANYLDITADGTTVYISDYGDGSLHAINVQSGQETDYAAPVLARQGLGVACMADGSVLFNEPQGMFSFSPVTGTFTEILSGQAGYSFQRSADRQYAVLATEYNATVFHNGAVTLSFDPIEQGAGQVLEPSRDGGFLAGNDRVYDSTGRGVILTPQDGGQSFVFDPLLPRYYFFKDSSIFVFSSVDFHLLGTVSTSLPTISRTIGRISDDGTEVMTGVNHGVQVTDIQRNYFTPTLTIAAALSSNSQTTTLTANIGTTDPDAGVKTPTGTVSFYDLRAVNMGRLLLGSAPVVNGKVTLALTGLTDSHYFYAVYNGDGDFAGSTSDTITYSPVHAPAAFIPLYDLKDFTYDSLRNRIYAITAWNQISRFDLNTQQFLTPWTVVGSPQGLDVSADKQTLYVSDRASGAIHAINLQTNAITKYNAPSIGLQGAGIAAQADGTVIVEDAAYFTGDYRFDPVAHSFTPLPNSITSSTFFHSANHAFAAAMSEYYVMTISQAGIVGMFDPFENGPGTHGALSADGTLVALMDAGGNVRVYRTDGSASRVPAPPDNEAIAFDPVLPRLYVMNGTTVSGYDTTTYQVVQTLHFALPLIRGESRMSDDGRTIVANSAAGLEVLNIPSMTTSITLTPSVSSADAGSAVRLNVALAHGPSDEVPTGTVEYFDGQVSLGVALIANGTAFLDVHLPSGTHSLTAVYGGDRNFNIAGTNTATVTINKIAGTGSLTIDNSTSPTSAFLSSLTFQFHMTAPGIVVPNGTVRIVDTASQAVLATASVVGGAASGTLASLLGGGHTLRADYTNGTEVLDTSSSPVSVVITPIAAFMDLLMRGTIDRSLDARLSSFDISASVQPTGTFTYYDDSTALGTGPAGNSFFSLAPEQLTPVVHHYTYQYSGDANYLPGTSPVLTYDNRPPPPPPAATNTALTSTIVNAGINQNIQLTATVTSAMAAAGTVIFKEGTTTLGTAPLVGGKATITTSFANVGAHALAVAFQPMSNSQESFGFLTVNVAFKTVVDVLAVYTAQTLSGGGGLDSLLQDFQIRLKEANTFLSNSQIPLTLRLVGFAPVSYHESGNFDTDLNRLTNPADGYMDTVAGLRNLVGADAVVLLDSASTATEAGVAWEFDPANKARDLRAFAVIDETDPRGGMVLAHELGHVMGAAHAVNDPSPTGTTPYAHGYRFIGTDGIQYHDIMAYDPGTLVPYFSNPNIIAAGVPEGNAKTANAARTITELSPTVAAYRTAKPIVSIDQASMTAISGWALDPRATEYAGTLRFDVDGVTRGTITASNDRPDLAPYFYNTRHGFSWTIPLLAEGFHTVQIYYTDSVTGLPVLMATRTISAPSIFFDEAYYLAKNPDIATAVRNGVFTSGWQHFSLYGQYESRNPSQYFDRAYYLAQNPDVAAAVLNGTIKSAFQHFVLYGQREGRKASVNFSEAFYLSQYPDIAAAVRAGYLHSGLEHYLLYGQFEGRKPLP